MIAISRSIGSDRIGSYWSESRYVFFWKNKSNTSMDLPSRALSVQRTGRSRHRIALCWPNNWRRATTMAAPAGTTMAAARMWGCCSCRRPPPTAIRRILSQCGLLCRRFSLMTWQKPVTREWSEGGCLCGGCPGLFCWCALCRFDLMQLLQFIHRLCLCFLFCFWCFFLHIRQTWRMSDECLIEYVYVTMNMKVYYFYLCFGQRWNYLELKHFDSENFNYLLKVFDWTFKDGK